MGRLRRRMEHIAAAFWRHRSSSVYGERFPGWCMGRGAPRVPGWGRDGPSAPVRLVACSPACCFFVWLWDLLQASLGVLLMTLMRSAHHLIFQNLGLLTVLLNQVGLPDARCWPRLKSSGTLRCKSPLCFLLLVCREKGFSPLGLPQGAGTSNY